MFSVLALLSAEEANPLGHVLDKPLFNFDLGGEGPLLTYTELDVGEIGTVSMQMITMVVTTAILIWIMVRVSKRIAIGSETEGNERYITKGRTAQVIEVIILYMRDQLIEPVLGKRCTAVYIKFLLTLFFFILALNLVGLIPLPDLQNIIGGYGWGNSHWAWIGGTATSNIAVTTSLALVSFIVIQIHSFKELGFLGWLDHLTCGLTKGSKGLWAVVPLVFIVEFAGVFIKPAALAIRLYANMLGGHILMATLLLFGTQAMSAGLQPWAWGSITLISGIFAVLLMFLELFVAVLQAFIFMFLTAVFISLMSHHEEHEEDHSQEAEHEGEMAAAH